MFTGLVEDTGTVAAVRPLGNGVELRIRTAIPLHEVEIGASIACDGCCLTVETKDGDCFTATAGKETLAHTTLGTVKPGRRIHLERALRVGDRLGGHLVQGHVDGVGTVSRVSRERESWVFWMEAPSELARYIAPKGSITIDGVSLTVNEIDGLRFRVNIVPHTIEVTRLGELTPGHGINLEVDILAKYVERLLQGGSDSGAITLDGLRRAGF